MLLIHLLKQHSTFLLNQSFQTFNSAQQNDVRYLSCTEWECKRFPFVILKHLHVYMHTASASLLLNRLTIITHFLYMNVVKWNILPWYLGKLRSQGGRWWRWWLWRDWSDFWESKTPPSGHYELGPAGQLNRWTSPNASSAERKTLKTSGSSL